MSNQESVLKEFIRRGENRKCFICGSNSPQYFVMDFLTVVCTTCSSVHIEFGHHVKNVSLASFTEDEVNRILSGGNRKCAAKYLRSYNPKKAPRPDPTDRVQIHQFIKNCFIDKIWMKDPSPRSEKQPSSSVASPPPRLLKKVSFSYEDNQPNNQQRSSLPPTRLMKKVSYSCEDNQPINQQTSSLPKEEELLNFGIDLNSVSQSTNQTNTMDFMDYQYPGNTMPSQSAQPAESADPLDALRNLSQPTYTYAPGYYGYAYPYYNQSSSVW